MKQNTALKNNTSTDTEIRNRLVDSNLDIIAQLIQGFERIEKDLYTLKPDNKSPIGAHVRHIIEFYEEFFKSINADNDIHLSYDKRQRNTIYEQSPESALEVLKNIRHQLETFSNTDQNVFLSVTLDPLTKTLTTVRSTLYRELHYLLDHTTHHMALIKMIAELQSLNLGDNFGMAHATRAATQD